MKCFAFASLSIHACACKQDLVYESIFQPRSKARFSPHMRVLVKNYALSQSYTLHKLVGTPINPKVTFNRVR